MGYMKIGNLYKDKLVLLFNELYAMEKVHGTSANIAWDNEDKRLMFFNGGASRELFVSLFDQTALTKYFENIGRSMVIYGEAYGGSVQKMSDTYGKTVQFIAFDVFMYTDVCGGDGCWLDVPNAEQVVMDAGLVFMPYKLIPATMEDIDRERDRDSIVAVDNGCGEGKMREGIVLRPVIELTTNAGRRVMAKHKRDDFRETKTPRVVTDEELQVLTDAKKIAEEWVTEHRLDHVLDKLGNPSIEQMRDVLTAMCEDIRVEAEGEIVWGKTTHKAITCATATMFKARLQASLEESK